MPEWQRDSHCAYCGSAFEPDAPWPRTCQVCGNTRYRNPLPVSVVLVPVDGGVLAVRRAIEPSKGRLALPGGYINWGESWQEAGAREVEEETGLRLDPAEIAEFRVKSAPDGTLLVFGQARPRSAAGLPPFEPTPEASERVILRGPEELAFSTYTEVVREFFERASRRAG